MLIVPMGGKIMQMVMTDSFLMRSADTLFRQQSIVHNMNVQYQVTGSHTSQNVWDFTLVTLSCGQTSGRANVQPCDHQNFLDG